MKRYVFPIVLMLSFALHAQTSQKIGYQSVVRDENGDLVAEKNINIRITILQKEVKIYQETHSPTTNVNGLFSIEIGGGTVVKGTNLGDIDWSAGACFAKVEIALKPTSYAFTSTFELLAVPYAFHAQTAEKLTENPQETDPLFSASIAQSITETDVLKWNNKLDSVNLDTIKNDLIALKHSKLDTSFASEIRPEIDFLHQNKVDSTFVNAKLKTLETLVDTALLSLLKAEIEALKQSVSALQTANEIAEKIANGTLVKDIDGNVYKTQKYGTQTWMIENLRVTRFNDGTAIEFVQDSAAWGNATTTTANYNYIAPPMYCISDTTPENIVKYGALYNWYCADPAKGKQLCPSGWHIPSLSEWKTLLWQLVADGYNYNGTTSDENNLGISMSAGDWDYSNIVGSPGNPDYFEKKNATNFSGYPVGIRSADGGYDRIGAITSWWASSSGYAYSTKMGEYAGLRLETDYLTVCTPGSSPVSAKSIRCVKD